MASTAIAPCSTFSNQKIAGPPACSTTFLYAPKWIASTAPVSHCVLRSPLPIELPFCGPSPSSSYSFRFLSRTAGPRSWSASAFQESNENVPTPIVTIDQDSDPNATVVEIGFGDRLGALIDTMRALKDLRLDVAKGNVTTDPLASVIRTKFFITRSDTGRKVENPEMLEAIRLTIIRNLLKYHPESSESLAMGEALGMKAPAKTIDADIATHIQIVDDGPKRSLLTLEAADRPGLLMEVVQIMNDINVSVESAEIDTEGLVAKDKFHVNYHGQALNKSLAEVLTNCLRYHLRKPITDEESY